MTDLPSSVGYITVTAKGILGLADSNDGGTRPDGVPMIARVTFKSTATRPVVAIGESSPKSIISLATITCSLDANGVLRPPTDGMDTGEDDTGELRLVAPDDVGIDYTGWRWVATFIPAAGQKWSAFSVEFGGTDGQTVDLGDVIAETFPPGVPAIVDPWLKAWAKDPDTLIVGSLVYDSPTHPDELLTADVLWPDGTPGTLTITGRNAVSRRATGWTITRGLATYTQPTITFNGSGDPTVIPAITVS